MPGKTEYWYVLRLEGDKALKEAQQFSKAVQKEMQQIKATASIVLKATVDTKVPAAAAQTQVTDMQKVLEKSLKDAQSDFMATTRKYGAQEMTSSLSSVWQEGTIKPSEKAISSIRQAQAAMVDLGKTAKKMGVTTDELVDMSSMDRAITSVQAIQRRMWGLRGFGYQLEAYGKSLTMAATAAAGGIALASNAYLKFADPMNKAARNLDLNAELTGALDQKLTELAGTVSVMTPQEQAEGLYLWAAATGAVVESEAELDAVLRQSEQVQRLAILGNVDYGVAVEATTDILSQYQLNISDTAKVTNVLIKVAAVSKAEVGDLAQAFSFAGARANQANSSFEDTAAVFQLLSAYGLRGSRAGRGVAMLMENLIAPSEAARKEMDALFTDVFGRTDVLETAEGQFVGIVEAVNTLATATANLTEMEQQEFVAKLTSQNASRAIVPLLDLERKARERGISAISATSNILQGVRGEQEEIFLQMMASITGYTVDTESATTTAERYWRQFTESLVGQAELTKAAFNAAITDIGRDMTTVLLPYMQKAADLAKDLAGYVKEHPGATKGIIGATAIAGVVGLLTTAVGKGIRLVADVKTVAMASSLYQTATMQITAANTMLAAAQMELQAAGIEAAAAETELAGASAEAAGGALFAGGGVGGSALLGVLGSPAALAAAVAGVIILLNHLRKQQEARQDEAAAVAASSSTYEGYINTLRRAGDEQYAVTEGVYDLIQAKKDEDEVFGQADAEEYARQLSAARRDLEAMFVGGMAGLARMRGLQPDSEAQIELIKLYTQQAFADMVTSADMATLALLQQHDLLADLADQGGITAETYAVLIDELDKLVLRRQVMGEDGYGTPGRPPEEMAYEYLATGEITTGANQAADAVEGLEEETDQLSGTMLRTKSSLDILVDGTRNLDLAMRNAYAAITNTIAALQGIPGLEGVLAGLQSRLEGITGDMRLMRAQAIHLGIEEGAKLGIQSVEDLASATESAADSMFDSFAGLSDIFTSEQIMGHYQDYLTEMETTYNMAAMMGEREGQLFIQRWQDKWDTWVGDHRDAQDQITRDAEQAAEDRKRLLEQAQEGFKGLVEAALQPTSVTGLDMINTDMGAYVDKWDENARRMRAAMEDPGGQWGFMIPENIRAQGLDAAKAWGANWIDEFYAGMHPEDIQWDKFIEQFKAGLQREASQKALIDTAIGKLAEEGITATSAEVLAALGMQSPLQQMFLGGLTPDEATKGLSGTMGSVISGISVEEGTFDTAAGAVSGEFKTALLTSLNTTSLPSMLSAMWTQQMKDTPDPIIAVGKAAGQLFWNGFEQSMEGSTFVDTIVGIALESLAAELEKRKKGT